MDASLLIGAPIGLGILLAFGIVMVAMAYLAQCGRTPAVCYSYPTRLPGLIAACAGFFGLARRRRKETA